MSVLPWIAFVVLVILLLALDLGVLHRGAHTIGTGEALRATAFWVFVAGLFNGLVYFLYEHQLFGIGTEYGHAMPGGQAALQWLTAYVVEETLSIDNLFVMALIFRYFAVPNAYQHRVLFLGIIGALVFRGVFIGAGLAFIHRFSWAIYVFGGLLVITAVKLLASKDESVHPERHPLVRLVQLVYPMTSEYHGDRFFVRIAGRLTATPLCLALVLVESSDIVFAIDSVPAVFAVTRDPFIAFTSNVFAMLGLRSIYFALAAAVDAFRYLKLSLVFILGFVGVKMLLSEVAHIGTLASLATIAGILGAGVIASLVLRDAPARRSGDHSDEPADLNASAKAPRPSGSD